MSMASIRSTRGCWRRSVRGCGRAPPYGVIKLAEAYGIALTGLRATVVGASNIVGRPMALELLLARSTVTVCHTGTRDLRAEVERAEILVAEIGRAAARAGWITPVPGGLGPMTIAMLLSNTVDAATLRARE